MLDDYDEEEESFCSLLVRGKDGRNSDGDISSEQVDIASKGVLVDEVA
jgi:hypothetical protein